MSAPPKSNKEKLKHAIRSNNAVIIAENQQQIIRFSRAKQFLILRPFLLNHGSIEHYYHFIVDLLLPLSIVVKLSAQDCRFLIEEDGLFTGLLQRIFPDRVLVQQSRKAMIPESADQMDLIGMNPRTVYLNHAVVQDFCFDICSAFKLEHLSQPRKILLVERLPPHSYFLFKAKRKGGGSFRRKIRNHKKLAQVLQSMVKAPFEFHNLQLEKISFEEQVELFSQAKIVIAQHGAGLVNSLWMQPESIVIELSCNLSHDHFQIISRLKKHHHYTYPTSSQYPVIDPEHFIQWTLQNEKLRECFHEA